MVIAPAKACSPLTKVKRDCIVLMASLVASVKKRKHQIFELKAEGLQDVETSWSHISQISELQVKGQQDQKKIAEPKACNNQLMQDIIQERRACNKIIDEAMLDAHKLSTEALEMISDANIKCAKVKAQVIAEHTHANARICEARELHSRESTRLWNKVEKKLKKHDQEQEAAINQDRNRFEKRHDKVRS